MLRLYVAEDDAGALRTVQAGLERCDVASRRECPDSGKALLLRDLGIVQAGAYRDHAAAVAAFREALRLDPNVTVPADLMVDRVREAFVEAGGKVTTKAPSAEAAVAAEATSDQASTFEPEPEKRSRYDAGDAFVLVAGTWGGGSDATGTFMSEWGGAVSGAWHVAGPLAVGARLAVSGTVSATIASTGEVVGPDAVLGAAALVGVLPRGKRNTGYFMLGIGPDYVPERDRARTVVSLAAGVSFGGFAFGGMPAFIFSQGQTGGAMWLFVGWGNYVKD